MRAPPDTATPDAAVRARRRFGNLAFFKGWRTGGVMENRDFVKLWVGESVSLAGTQVTLFALPLVAIITLHVSTFQVGVLNATRYAPVVVLSLFAGVWLDRRRRRPILVTCSLLNGALIALIPLAYEAHFLSMGLLYVVGLSVGSVSVVFDVGVLSYVPWLVDEPRPSGAAPAPAGARPAPAGARPAPAGAGRAPSGGVDHLAQSNTMIQTSNALAGMVGPGLAGFLIGLVGAPVALVADAVSYFCSAVGLGSIRHREAPPASAAQRPPVGRSIREGLDAVYGTPLLLGLLTQSATFNFLQNAFVTIFLVYAIRYLHLTPFRLGLVVGGLALGGVFGAMFANRLRVKLGFGRTVWMSTIVASACPLAMLVPRGSGVGTVALLTATEAVFGFFLLAFNVNTITLRQRVTPKSLLGRMNASYRMVLFGTGPIGAILGGWLGSLVGLRPALVTVALLLVCPVAWVVFSPVFRLKDIPEPVQEAAPASAPA